MFDTTEIPLGVALVLPFVVALIGNEIGAYRNRKNRKK